VHAVRTRSLLAVIVSLAALCSACATSGPALDRQRDAADIFTAVLGTGLGVKARIGPLQFALLGDLGGIGLRGGTTFCLIGNEPPGDSMELAEGLVNVDGFAPDSRSTRVTFDRRKAYGAVGVLVFTVPQPADGLHWYDTAPYYFTQLEVVVGLGLSARLGFNPGELLDFTLGWFGIDIYNDDLERRKANGPADALRATPAGPQHDEGLRESFARWGV
jgi:hypothetical protein